MGYADRALKTLLYGLKEGNVKEIHVKNCLKCRVETQGIEPYLFSNNYGERRAAFSVVSKWGDDINKMFGRMLVEKDSGLLLTAMRHLSEREINLEPLVEFLYSEDHAIKEAAIQMFRKTGQEEEMFGLLFDDDESLANRVKRYMGDEE